jgi:outer membrane receptor protein involved in Fe transport
VGVDLRFVRGEAREEFGFADSAFTRGLVAGGDQGNAGIFLLRDQELSSTFRVLLGARVDAWNEGGGHEEMTDLENGEVLGAEKLANASGTEFCPSVGLVWRPSGDWRLHVNAQQSFSRPTLSELYQPYGWDSIVTQSNPQLKTERNTSFEASAEYTFHLGPTFSNEKSAPDVFYKAPAAGALVVGATVFSNNLRDSVGTVTLVRDTAEFPIFTTLPPGYFGQQLLSLDRSTSRGGTVFIQWGPTNSFSLNASLILEDSTIDRSSLAPQLNGKRTAGVSRASSLLTARWRATDRFTFRCLARVLGSQFEDDENTIRLGESVVVDVGLSYRLSKYAEVFLAVDNLANERIETSRSIDGIFYLASPRLEHGGVRLSW